jgi:hypothetical protein
MSKLSQTLSPLCIIASIAACTAPNAREHSRISQLHEIAVQPGVNKIELLAPDGRAGMIVTAGAETGAGANTTYMVMLPDTAGTGWSLVSPDDSPGALSGNGQTSAIRFARGYIGPDPQTLLIIAMASTPQAGPQPYDVRVYRLATGRQQTGIAPSGFEQVQDKRSDVKYSSADAAIMGEMGLR